jgi:hypothetical protein
MSTSFLPAKDALLATWMQNFSTLITAAPATYGLAAADAVAIAAAVNPFISALATSTNPSTRTPTTVNAKNVARNSATVVVRGYGDTIRANTGVTDANKLALGLVVRDPTQTPIPAPTTSPILTIIAATPLQHTVRFADQNTPASRAKPSGVTQMQLYVSVGTVAPVSPDATPFYGVVTKNPVAVNFASGDVGKTAYYYARWQTRRGLVGPWSALLQFTVAG